MSDGSPTDAPSGDPPAAAHDPADLPWPADDAWIVNGPLGPPGSWGRPGVILAFHLECAGCVGRAVPFLKRLLREHEGRFQPVLLHTAYGHRPRPQAHVVPEATRFLTSFARLDWPTAIDADGSVAQAWGAEGTPHWFVHDADGRRVRDLYGSQENATTRLAYLMDELLGPEGR